MAAFQVTTEAVNESVDNAISHSTYASATLIRHKVVNIRRLPELKTQSPPTNVSAQLSLENGAVERGNLIEKPQDPLTCK